MQNNLQVRYDDIHMARKREAYEMTLLGQRITVKTHLSPDQMKDLVVLIESQFQQVKDQASLNAPLQKLHLLSMLSIAEKYFTLRAQVENFRKEVSGEIKTIKKFIDRFNQETIAEGPARDAN